MLESITYIPSFVSEPDKVMASLKNDLDWERRGDAPRCEYYCNDFDRPYIYGQGKYARTYLVRPYHSIILEIRKALEAKTGMVYEVCFLNRYLDQSDQLGWHSDDSPEMDDARSIGIVSFGVEREIWFRARKNLPTSNDERTKLKLENGSLCLMAPGMQDTHQHRIPKASFQCGERISLTFRGYVLQENESK